MMGRDHRMVASAHMCPECGQEIIKDEKRFGGAKLGYRFVSLHGKGVDISTREHQILEALLTSYPGIVDRERLLYRVWGEEGTDNVLSVYVSKLRKKLPKIGMDIKTVWGAGHKLVYQDRSNERYGKTV
jgi:DNA-binding response OmpR family regulator